MSHIDIIIDKFSSIQRWSSDTSHGTPCMQKDKQGDYLYAGDVMEAVEELKKYRRNEQKEQIIEQFKQNQTLTNLQQIKNAGMTIGTLKDNQWKPLHTYNLPFPNIIALYNDKFEIHAIGVYGNNP